MDALVSGSAGVAVLLDSARCWVLRADGSPKVEHEPTSLGFLFGDARDMRVLEGVDESFVRRELEVAHLGVQALHLALMLCDPETSVRATELATERLDDLLASKDVTERVERILYARPIPKPFDLSLAIQRSAARSRGHAGRVFDALLARQPIIQEVRAAWNSLPGSVFDATDDRRIADGTLAREGVYRQLVDLLEAHGSLDGWLQFSLRVPAVHRLRGHETWLSALQRVLAREEAQQASRPIVAATRLAKGRGLSTPAHAALMIPTRARRGIIAAGIAVALVVGGVALAQVLAHRRTPPSTTAEDAIAAPPPSRVFTDRTVRSTPANLDGVLTSSRITAGLAASLRKAGTRIVVRYLPLTDSDFAKPLGAAEVRAILGGGLGLMAAQVPHAGGWVPTAALGAIDGAKAVDSARTAELPPRVCLWLIVEATGGPATAIVAYINAWAAEVRNGGYDAGVSLGPDTALTATDLASIRAAHFWRIAPSTPQPTGGYQIVQLNNGVTFNSQYGYGVAPTADAGVDAGASTYAETIQVAKFTFGRAPQFSPIQSVWSYPELGGDAGEGGIVVRSPVRGVSIPRHSQWNVNWGAEARSGVRFVMRECRDGNGVMDLRFAEDIATARDAGLVVGLYNGGFPLPPDPQHPERDAVGQARRDFDACHPSWRSGDLPPALLLEWPRPAEWADHGCSKGQVRTWALTYLEEATRLWGRSPLVRLSPDFAEAFEAASDEKFATYPLWISDSSEGYAGRLPPRGAMPVIPLPWVSWAIWQYAGAGVPGAFRLSNGAPSASDIVNNGEGGLDALRTLN
jgi:GH25 family lysozyme M1 (1,4-beta-N-acetylmuramidase)